MCSSETPDKPFESTFIPTWAKHNKRIAFESTLVPTWAKRNKEEYEVEAILRHRGKHSCHTFLIRWKGYSTAEDTWEPERNLDNTQPLISEYKIARPLDFPEYNHHHKARK